MELELRNISKNFGPKTVLRDLSLTAATGMCVGVLGRNGAGKSTLCTTPQKLDSLAGIVK